MYPQRCTDDKPHGRHKVLGCDGCGRTTFICAGRVIPAEIEDLLPPADHEHLIPGRIWPLQ